MTLSLLTLSSGVFILLGAARCAAQSPVVWQFRVTPLHGHETTLLITAQIAPGWHVYSQRIKKGGPVPTRIRYRPSEDYVLQGIALEEGNATTFYDSMYDTEITWYTGHVTFSQRLLLTRADATIEGTVTYMAWNNNSCVPAAQAFTIEIPPQDARSRRLERRADNPFYDP